MDVEPNSHLDGDTIRRLTEEHRHLSQQLESLIHKPYLSDEEKLQEVRLKKLKLHLKDQLSGLRDARPDVINAT